jgi:hypothetical protein
MKKNTELFLGLRKSNGQIGYFSESLNIPEFFNLVCNQKQEINILIDFSDVIEKLYSLHEKQNKTKMIDEYKSLYSYWSDSITYDDKSIKSQKQEKLSSSANDLLTKLKNHISSNDSEFSSESNNIKKLKIVKELADNSNIFIDVLLCFIHSKASIEISSFKLDKTITNYCDFLKQIVKKSYNNTIRSNCDGSILDYFAFENVSKLEEHLLLKEQKISTDSYILNHIKKLNPQDNYDNNHLQMREVLVLYKKFDYNEIQIVDILKDLMYKVKSISLLIEKLKNNGIEWDTDVESKKELISFMEKDIEIRN